MTKKILLIIGILAVVGIAVFLIFGSKPQSGGGSETGFSIREFLPFGGSGSTDNQTGSTTQGEPSYNPPVVETGKPIPKLRKISSEPVAGAVAFNVGTTSVVRFVERGTGNVYEAKSDSLYIQRLTNTTIPKIIRAYWLPNGSGFLAQTLMADSEIVETSFVKLNKNPASSTVESLTPFSTKVSKLPTGIREISIKPDGSKIFYYTTDSYGSSWYTANPDGTGAVLIITHSLTEWMPKWVSANLITMQNKSSSGSVEYAYSFDLTSKTLKKAGVGASGLSFLSSPDGSLSLISRGGVIPQLFLVENKNASVREVSANTLAEKCIWLKEKNPAVICAVPNDMQNGDYPDSWYKGLISTEDLIMKVDVNNNIFYKIADLYSLADQRIDVIDPNLSPNETHLIFRNKIDGFLWLLRIGE